MITKTFDVGSMAHTLSPCQLGEHSSGWIILGDIHEDWYEWVNEFTASHPVFGRVWGDFEHEVHADSEEAFEHFIANHEPNVWDYADI